MPGRCSAVPSQQKEVTVSSPTDPFIPMTHATVADMVDGPVTRRWTDQRWLVDNVIEANGIDWDQPRSLYLNAPCGPEANADFAGVRNGVKMFADISPAFQKVARHRQAKAETAEADGNLVTARENYFIAAIGWGAAQWPLHNAGPTNQALNQRKRDAYRKYARLADHRVEEVWIPFGDDKLPAWLHLPPGYTGGKLPVIMSFPGMDTFKELFVAQYGDRWLSRGVAVLALDGPGQAESRVLGLKVSMENWRKVGPAVLDWMETREEFDLERVGIFGNSFGSFFASIVVATEPRLKAAAVSATCLEPGFNTIFNEASPTYKRRFMYMSGYEDEAEFDDFIAKLTWEGHVGDIKIPYLVVAGDREELCQLKYVEQFLDALDTDKEYVLYEGSRHAVGFVPSANLGPTPTIMIADWMVKRLNGEPMESRRHFVRASGEVVTSGF